MEAAACGLPVIAPTSAVADKSSPTGRPACSSLCMTPYDWPRQSRGSRRDRLGAGDGRRGRRKAEAEFDDQNVVAKSLKVYEWVLATTSSTRRRTPSSATRPSSRSRYSASAASVCRIRNGTSRQEAHGRRHEVLRIVRRRQMHPVFHLQTLHAEGGGHDRHTVGERLEDLHPCSTAVTDRHDGHRSASRSTSIDGTWPTTVSAPGSCSLVTLVTGRPTSRTSVAGSAARIRGR